MASRAWMYTFRMRFACVQFDIVWEDKPANHAIIERMLDAAQPAIPPGSLVMLPELGDTGFSMNLDRIADDLTLPWAVKLARSRGVFIQCGFARRDATASPPGRNCAVIVSPEGGIVAEYEKVHPFSFGREAEHYSGGSRLAIAHCSEACICPLICYDLRFPELWRLAAIAEPAAEAFTIGASWPAARQNHWRSLCIARAIENQAWVIAVNRCGNDPYLAYAGGSLIVSPRGEIVAEADSQPQVIQAEVDLAALRDWRREFRALSDVHRELLGRITIDRR